MARPPKCRLIARQPPVSAFKPAGIPGRELGIVELGLDELEALRLADLEGLYHDAAADQMRVSRPTFGRLVERARHKVACALFQSKMLVFQGGPIMVANMRTFECAGCGASFQVPHGTGRPAECPQCHGSDFHRVVEEPGQGSAGRRHGAGSAGAGQGRGRCVRRRRGWAKLARSTQASAAQAEDSQ